MRCGLCVLALLTALPGEDKPLRVQMVAQDAPGHWQAQLLGDLDRPVGDKIEFGGQTLPAKVNDRGALELDVKNDGKPRTISGKREIVLGLPSFLTSSSSAPRSFTFAGRVWPPNSILSPTGRSRSPSS